MFHEYIITMYIIILIFVINAKSIRLSSFSFPLEMEQSLTERLYSKYLPFHKTETKKQKSTKIMYTRNIESLYLEGRSIESGSRRKIEEEGKKRRGEISTFIFRIFFHG